jgi:magnesium-transporting ATPase (P-type)
VNKVLVVNREFVAGRGGGRALAAASGPLTGLTVAFATVPEGLPMVVVVVLGLGSRRLV